MFKKKKEEFNDVPQQNLQQPTYQQNKSIKIVTAQNLGDLHYDVIDGIAFSIVKSRNTFSQFGAGVKSVFGGNLGSFEKLYDTMRQEVLLGLQAQALEMGADAIISLRIDINELMRVNGVAVVGYGTAVKVKNEDSFKTQQTQEPQGLEQNNNPFGYNQ